MPNWCSTRYYIYSPKAELIYDALVKATSTYSDPEIWSASKNWYGYLAVYSGRFYDCYSCRGAIESVDLDEANNEVTIFAEDAWAPHPQLLVDFVHDYDEEAQIYYTAEEPGCEIYCTNDPDEVGHIYIECDFNGLSPEWERFIDRHEDCRQDDLVEDLCKMLGKKGTLEELTKEMREQNPDAYINIHTYEYVPLEDWN